MDPTIFLGRVAFLDVTLRVTLATHLAASATAYSSIAAMLTRLPVQVRLKALGDLVAEVDTDGSCVNLVNDLRELFAMRNTYAHTMWLFALPDAGSWLGFYWKGGERVKVVITREVLEDANDRAAGALDRLLVVMRKGQGRYVALEGNGQSVADLQEFLTELKGEHEDVRVRHEAEAVANFAEAIKAESALLRQERAPE